MRHQPAMPLASYFALRDESCRFQDPQMFHHGGEGDVVWFSQFRYGSFAPHQDGEHGSTRRIGESRERRIEGERLLNHVVKYYPGRISCQEGEAYLCN